MWPARRGAGHTGSYQLGRTKLTRGSQPERVRPIPFAALDLAIEHLRPCVTVMVRPMSSTQQGHKSLRPIGSVPERLRPQVVIATALAKALDGVIQLRVCRGLAFYAHRTAAPLVSVG